MPLSNLFSRYGIIGEDLELKQNIEISINAEGRISNLEFEDIKNDEISLKEENSNSFIIPGFINSHVHIADNFAKEGGYNRNLLDIVAPPNGLKHKLLRNTAKQVKLLSIKKGVEELLSNGITTFIDFREGGIKGINLIKEVLEGTDIIYKIQGRYSNKDEIEGIFDLADGLGLSSYSKVKASHKELIKSNKKRFKKLVACHDAENKRKPKLFEKLIKDDIVDVIIHGTHYLEKDFKQIIKNNLALVLCPRSNAYFGVGFPDIKTILKLGMKISIGTDNLMAISPNLFEEIRYLYFRAREMGLNNQSGLNAKELLKMITINAARNFKLKESMGSISEGKLANFNIINLNDSNFFTQRLNRKKFFPLVIQRTKTENIKKTIIRGKVVHERKY